MSDLPYDTSASILDCQQATKGYNKPSYPDGPSCNTPWPSCDNRTYSAYALDASYSGYYDDCFNAFKSQPACDLKYVNASPKTVIDCWKQCYNDEMKAFSKDCQVQCVVNGGGQPSPKPTPAPLPTPSPLPSPSPAPQPSQPSSSNNSQPYLPTPFLLNTYVK